MKKLFFAIFAIIAISLIQGCSKDYMIVGDAPLEILEVYFVDSEGNDLINPATKGSLYGSLRIIQTRFDRVNKFPSAEEDESLSKLLSSDSDSIKNLGYDPNCIRHWVSPYGNNHSSYFYFSFPGAYASERSEYSFEIYVDSTFIGKYDCKVILNNEGKVEPDYLWNINGENVAGLKYTIVIDNK